MKALKARQLFEDVRKLHSPDAPDPGVPHPVPGSVFELIELQQCDDNYFPLGIFLSLADAVAAVEENGVGICNDPEEWAGVEIKERKLGLSDNGRTVWERSWERDWSDEATERWKLIGDSQNH